jgi:hypothetical protein
VNERNEESARPARAALGIAVAGVVVLVFAALGGVGSAKNPASAAQYQYGKATICHKAGPHGKRVTITVGANAVPAHLRHGDTMGPCPATRTRKGKGKAGSQGQAKAGKATKPSAAKGKGGQAAKPSAGKGPQPTQPAAPPAAAPGNDGKGNEGKGDKGDNGDNGNNGNNGNGNNGNNGNGKGKGKG